MLAFFLKKKTSIATANTHSTERIEILQGVVEQLRALYFVSNFDDQERSLETLVIISTELKKKPHKIDFAFIEKKVNYL